jgi:hypothetical protein
MLPPSLAKCNCPGKNCVISPCWKGTDTSFGSVPFVSIVQGDVNSIAASIEAPLERVAPSNSALLLSKKVQSLHQPEVFFSSE